MVSPLDARCRRVRGATFRPLALAGPEKHVIASPLRFEEDVMSKSAWENRARRLLEPLVGGLAAMGATPTGVTLAGLALNIAAGVVIGIGHAPLGGITLLVAGLCDTLDGQLARRTGRTS